MKTKLMKIISSAILMAGGALALTAGLIVGNSNNNVEVQNERAILGSFNGSPLSTTSVEVEYQLYGAGSSIYNLYEIEYTFIPEGLGNPVVYRQTNNFPSDFLKESTYIVNSGIFTSGETYQGNAKIVLKDGTFKEQDFENTFIMPAGEPLWDTANTKAVGYINGAQLSLSIQGINANPSNVFDPDQFYVEVKEISLGDIVTTKQLSNELWSDSTGTWTTEIRIENILKANTDYRAKFYFKGNGQDLPNTTTGLWEYDFTTIDKVDVPDWMVSEAKQDYEQVDIKITSDDVFHDWHGSLLGNAKPRIEYIKNITTGTSLQESQYAEINNNLSSWEPSETDKQFNETFTIKDLKPENHYEGNLIVHYNENLVKSGRKEIPFTFDTKLKKHTPTISVENVNHTQIIANGWETQFGIKVTPALAGGGREGATFEDVLKMEATLFASGETNIVKTINASDIVSSETIVTFGDSNNPLKANTKYNLKIVTTMTPIVSNETIEVNTSFTIPKNVEFIKPVMNPTTPEHTNNSMSFYLTWASNGFNIYEENISRLEYSTDGNNWTMIHPGSDNNTGYNEFTIAGLGPNENNDIYLRVEPNLNTEPGSESDGSYIWYMGDDDTDYNPAPEINIDSVDVKQTSVAFELTILNHEYLTGINIKTTDLDNSNAITDVNIPSNQISKHMTLTIDEVNGIVDFNEYLFKITFQYDPNITYEPIITVANMEIGGTVTGEIWTSEIIKTLPKQMQIISTSIVSMGYDPDTLGNLYKIEYNVLDTKGYLRVEYIIEDEQDNETQRIISTNTINEGINHRYIGNLELGYTVTIELWGESTTDANGSIMKHDFETININK